jgi:hypothetical protein
MPPSVTKAGRHDPVERSGTIVARPACLIQMNSSTAKAVYTGQHEARPCSIQHKSHGASSGTGSTKSRDTEVSSRTMSDEVRFCAIGQRVHDMQ